MIMEKLEPDQWADRYWEEFERARRRKVGLDLVGGEQAARQAWDRMLELYGDPPPEDPMSVPARPYVDQRPTTPGAVAELAERYLGVELTPWQQQVLRVMYADQVPAPPCRRGWLRRAIDRVFG
jgi:hypothetical protein